MANYRGSSRLAKRENKKLGKQIFFLIFGGLVILVLFIFVLIPLLTGLFFDATEKVETIKDTTPPQMPILSSVPPEATASATLVLSGYAEAKSQVVFILNNNEDSIALVGDDGQFEQTLHLNDDLNTITLYGLDAAGNESLQTKTYQILRDQLPPAIDLLEPADGANIELKKNRTLTVKGETELGAKMTLNERMISVDEMGNFSGSYYLDEGANELKFVATDKAGNKSEKTITVKFKL